MKLPNKAPEIINRLASDLGGKVEECERLPDGSGFAVVSMPLPKDHWLTAEGYNKPPMPFRLGTEEDGTNLWPKIRTRQEATEMIQAAARYAIRAATMNGAESDFDPDAMVQNFVTGMLGYYTPNALSSLDGNDESPR